MRDKKAYRQVKISNFRNKIGQTYKANSLEFVIITEEELTTKNIGNHVSPPQVAVPVKYRGRSDENWTYHWLEPNYMIEVSPDYCLKKEKLIKEGLDV